jgi:hypothetical protein
MGYKVGFPAFGWRAPCLYKGHVAKYIDEPQGVAEQ